MNFEWNILWTLKKKKKALWKSSFIISKYCPIKNSNVNTVVTQIWINVESSSDSDSSNEKYKY